MSEIQSNLVVGSVWERKTKNGSKSNIVLLLTNQDLSPEIQAENPVQVVFLTESQAILSTPVESFLKRRTYVGMNANVVSHMGAINEVAFDEEDGDDEGLDIGALPVDESQFTTLIDASAGSGDDEDGDDEDYDGAGELFLNVGPHPLKEALESSFIGYKEAPFHTGDTLHTLSFMLDESVTLQAVQSAFSTNDPNAIQKFEVTVPALGAFQVDHEGLVGVFLESNGSFSVASLNLTSKGDFRAEINTHFTPATATPEAAPEVTPVATSTPAPQTAAPQVSAPQAVVVVS